VEPATRGRALAVDASLAAIPAVREFVLGAARELGFAEAGLPAVELAVDEAVTNVVVHGYRGEPGPLEVAVERDGDRLVVRVRDRAPPFDPARAPAPDLTSPLDERPVGGLGVHLIRQAVDEMRHRTPEGGGNELTLVKRLPRNGTA
jgi:serine/threonine-protein kinase RsbW